MNAVLVDGEETQRRSARRIALKIVMRVVMPSLMIGFAAYTVANGGLQGLVALLPILAAHVVGFLVIFPLWVRFRRRHVTTAAE